MIYIFVLRICNNFHSTFKNPWNCLKLCTKVVCIINQSINAFEISCLQMLDVTLHQNKATNERIFQPWISKYVIAYPTVLKLLKWSCASLQKEDWLFFKSFTFIYIRHVLKGKNSYRQTQNMYSCIDLRQKKCFWKSHLWYIIFKIFNDIHETRF